MRPMRAKNFWSRRVVGLSVSLALGVLGCRPEAPPPTAPAPRPAPPVATPATGAPDFFLPTAPSETPPPTLEETADSIAAARLAGLGAPTAGLDDDAARRLSRYAESVAPGWSDWEQEIGAPMLAWSEAELAHAAGDTIFYPFSGPDFSTVHRLYPRAERYVLVAMQKAGPPLHPEQLRKKELDEALDLLGTVFENFTRKGFFITEQMNDRFGHDQPVKGLTPLLMAFAAREGFLVERVEPIRVDADAQVVTDPGDRARLRTWDSVRLHLVERSSGRAVTLDYVRMNLGDRRLVERKDHMQWLDRMTRERVFVKAASHLMQQSNFAFIRDAILRNARSLLQDESGIAYSRLEVSHTVRLYGAFTHVNTLFFEELQSGLAEAYASRKDVAPLPFEIGYRKRAGSCLQLATRKPASGGASGGAGARASAAHSESPAPSP